MNRKEEWLQAATDWVLDDGIHELTVRELARRLKTSGRMVIYYFETREALVNAVLLEIRRRLQMSWESYAAARAVTSVTVLLEVLSEWASSPANQKILISLLELRTLAARRPQQYSILLSGSTEPWLNDIRRLCQAERLSLQATEQRELLLSAAIRGVLWRPELWQRSGAIMETLRIAESVSRQSSVVTTATAG
jgi:AcrR family transcriptional regulator